MSPIIVPVCTKIDSDSDTLNPKMIRSILELCRNKVEQVISREKTQRKVILVNEIIHTTAANDVPSTTKVRMSLENLRHLIATLCEYSSRYNFCIPKNWMTIGKLFTECNIYLIMFFFKYKN